MNALLIFLVIVILVTAVLVYLYFNKMGPWKKGASPAPAPGPAPGPALPSITDFSVDRTLSPPKTDTYTIEPYTIEGYTAADLLSLSKNVTFTLTWKNGLGFTEAGVNKIEVYHGVMGSGTTTGNPSGGWKLRETIKATSTDDTTSTDVTPPPSNPPLGLNNFDTVSVEISGNGNYSFAGTNFFKIVAYYGDDNIELHNDSNLYIKASASDKTNYGIVISGDELVGTTELLTPETITYEPRLDSSKGQSFKSEIANQTYDFYYYPKDPNVSPGTEPYKFFYNVRLVPVDSSGIRFKLENVEREKYFNIETRDFDQEKFSGGSVVEIAESLETDTRGHDKVIMLKAEIDGEDKYYFGYRFRALNDPNITTADEFFRRNIYIKKHEENST